MYSQDFRRRFLQYFKEKGHRVVPSSPVVPHDDPTLLFNNAGMNQFKDVFTGESKRDYVTATSSQKCLRVGGKHNDLDNVGHTARHLTFFEMLGNFSFGDYFKKEAIDFALDVTLNVFEFPFEKLWVTVYEEDDEAFELWKKHMPEERIVRLGKEDNYWAMGETGPCGPCSELHFDRGEKFGTATHLKEDTFGDRYIEFWNLVFMQFNRDESGKLSPLPSPSIDTGAGLERLISLKMNTDTLFETDILRHIIVGVEELTNKTYDKNAKSAPAFRVIADHLRALSFAIADGAQPSNLDRGYVLRKLLRRAVRYGRSLNIEGPFLSLLLPRLIEVMGDDYRELIDAQARISEILTVEEEAFIRTLKRGGNILTSVIADAKKSPQKQITGEEAFKLKDTYGFPLEEILLIAKDNALEVNLETYQVLEKQAKERSRASREVVSQQASTPIYEEYLSVHGQTEFVGYTENSCDATIMAILVNGKFVDALHPGEKATVFLNKTPFYAEKGGQIYDTGTLTHHNAHFKVTDCQNPYPGVIAHIGTLDKGAMIPSEPVHAEIDSARRQLIANHHTATHLLHWALQQVLGPHIRQAGSLVEPERLRFDFTHHKNLTDEEIEKIEKLVNDKIRENRSVETLEISHEEATERPEIKQFFGDKYGEIVRLVDIDYSKELCGGTHTSHLGTIGLFRIAKESSIAAGVRRIDGVTGHEAEKLMYKRETLLKKAADLYKTTPGKLLDAIEHGENERKELSSELKSIKRASLKQVAEKLLTSIETINSIPFLSHTAEDPSDLNNLAEELMSLVPSLFLVLGYQGSDRCQLLIRVSSDLIEKGYHAGKLIKEISPLIQGGGGGKADGAQAGGKNPSGIPAALKKARELIK